MLKAEGSRQDTAQKAEEIDLSRLEGSLIYTEKFRAS